MSDTTASRRQKINNAGDLQSVVCSMKAWAAASVGQYEKAMSALADYHRTVEPGLGVCFRGTGSAALMTGETRRADAGAIDEIVFGSDQGLVVQFNDVVADYAINTLAVLSGKTTAHVLVCPVVGWSPRDQRKALCDEPHRRMDEWLDGRRDVDLDGNRRTGGGPAGRRYQQAVDEVIQGSALLRSELLTKKANVYWSHYPLIKP